MFITPYYNKGILGSDQKLEHNHTTIKSQQKIFSSPPNIFAKIKTPCQTIIKLILF